MWEFSALIAGHNRAHGGPAKPSAPTISEHRERLQRAKARQAKSRKLSP